MNTLGRNTASANFILFFAVIALTTIMLAPDLIYNEMPLISDVMPPGVYYPLWPPGFFLIDIGLIAFVYVRFLLLPPKRFQLKLVLKLLLGIFIVCLALALQFNNGYFLDFYDGIAFILRFLIIFAMLYELTRSNFLIAYKLISSIVFILFIVSSVAFFVLGVEESTANRINLMGMGPNVSSDAILMVYSVSLILYKRNYISSLWLFVAFLPLIFFIPFTGSRRALIFAVILIFLTLSPKGRLAVGAIIIAIAFFITNYFSLSIDNILAEISTLLRILETFDQISTGSFQDGRSEMYQTAITTTQSNPFGVGLSDWAIQAEMAIHGVGSHTHNFFIQMYLKFGLLSVFIYLQFFYFIYFLIKHNFWYQLLFFGISFNTGYGFWNVKYALVFMWLCLLLDKVVQNDYKNTR